MSYPPKNGKHSYDLEIEDDIHWKVVEIGAVFKMHHENFAEFMIETAVKDFCEAEERRIFKAEKSDPLYVRMQSELDLYGSIWPPKLALMFEFLADIIEQRGAKDLDRDPGETADWLRQEARKVIEMEGKTESEDE
jgi:hypothetical protein